MLILILSKVLQGVGAAMTQGTSMAMIVSTFSSEERGRALGLQMSVVGTGGVAGPAVGGFLVSGLGWEWVFYFNVVLASLAIVAALIVLDGRRAPRDGSGPGFDWPGAAISTAALVIFLVAMSNGHSAGWSSPLIVLSLLGFLALLGAFVWWELRAPAPMLDVRLFQRKLFSLGVSASFISFLGMSSVRFLMPFYLQSILGYSAGQVGLIIVPSAIAMIVTGPLGGRLSDRYGWRIFNVGGLLLGASGLFLLTALDETSSLWLPMAGMILSSCGVGVFNAPNNSSILSAVEPSRYGVISGFLNLIRNSANVTSIALATAVVVATMASMGYPPTLAAVSDGGDAGMFEAFTSGMRVAFLTMGSIILVGVVLSFMKGGRVLLWGLKQPAMPWATDGPAEGEIGGSLETMLSHWADEAHAQGAYAIGPHFPMPNGEHAALIATGRLDGVEMLRQTEINHSHYYQYLNCGYRVPLVGGTDKMSNEVPVGAYRTYVYIPEDEEFNYDNWCKNVARGRTFLSGGPILHFSVDGHRVGDVAQMSGPGTVEVEAWAESILPIHRLEIVQEGRVVASTEDRNGTRRLELKEKMRVDRHTWLAARCGGPNYFDSLRHHDVWSRGIFAHSSPIYVACGGEWEMFDEEIARYMMAVVEGDLAYIAETSGQHMLGNVTHHHGEDDHIAYLQRPILEAQGALRRRMEDR